MSPKLRNGIYAALLAVNTVLTVCAQENAFPTTYAHYAALASLVLAALMKEFNAKDPVLPEAN